MMIVKESKIIYEEKRIKGIRSLKLTNPKSVYRFTTSIIGGNNSPTEYLITVALSDDAKPVSYIIMGNSSENEVSFSYTSILRFVILSGYEDFITIHNHPNDSPKFSEEDISSTLKLKKIAETIGLNLIGDYLICNGKCIKNIKIKITIK